MKYFIAPLALLALMAVAGNAAPYQGKTVAADAKWLVHVDADAIRDSYLVKKAFETCPELKNAGPIFDMIGEKIGVDLRKDLHGMTLYGPDRDPKHAVAIVFSKVDQKLLLEKAQKAAGHEVAKHGGVEIHSWTMKHGSKTESAAGAFYKSNVLVFAADAEQVAKAIDVLDGKSPSITDPNSPLGVRGVKGATVIIRAYDLPGNDRVPLSKQVKSIRIAMGENEGNSFYRSRVVMNSADTAQQIKTIAEGFKALASLRFSGEPDVMKLVNGLNITVSQSTVTVRWEARSEDVWKVIEKIAKKAGEHAKKLKELHDRGQDQGSDDI